MSLKHYITLSGSSVFLKVLWANKICNQPQNQIDKTDFKICNKLNFLLQNNRRVSCITEVFYLKSEQFFFLMCGSNNWSEFFIIKKYYKIKVS